VVLIPLDGNSREVPIAPAAWLGREVSLPMSSVWSERPGAEPMTVTVARRVAPGREAEFEEWAVRLTAAAARFPGFLGAGLLRPGHVGEDWHVVYRFDSAERLADWERSPIRAALLAEAEHLMRTVGVSRISGLETWFAVPGRTAPAPPRWKMFAISVVATYLLQLVVNFGLHRLAGPWPLAARLALFVSLVTASMTWLVMPRLARLLQRWLYAPPRSE
jgi:antibiotic biosynthesis monooxygenase (ABM) superfamily enzyme